MITNKFKKLRSTVLLLCGIGATSLLTGCYAGAVALTQSTIAGQTLPSAYYLRDDVQFFPAGSEEQLPKLRQALEEYQLEQDNIKQGLAEDGP